MLFRSVKKCFFWLLVSIYKKNTVKMYFFTARVGYVVSVCDDNSQQVVWKSQVSEIQGFHVYTTNNMHYRNKVAPFDLWSLNLQHRYFPERKTLYMGDGGEVSFKKQPRIVETVAGNGDQEMDVTTHLNGKELSFK